MANPTASGEGATPNPETGATPNTTVTGATPVSMTLEQALAELASIKHAHQNAVEERDRHRASLTKFERAQAEAEAAKLSDIEKATKRAEAAEAQAKQYQAQLQATQVKLAAQSMGFVNPDLAARLVSVDPDASDTDILKALQSLAQSDPYLIKAPESTPPTAAPRQAPSNPPRAGVNPPAPPPFDPKNPPSLSAIWNKPKP